MSLDLATIRRMATHRPRPVSRLKLPTLQVELDGMVGWIQQLNEVNVDGVEPLAGKARVALKCARIW